MIDFRTPGEVLLGGDNHLPFAVEYAHLPVSGGDLGAIYELIASGDHERQRRELGDGRAASFMVEMKAMLTGLRRALLGDLVPPEPVPLSPGPHPPPLPPTYAGAGPGCAA